jgi:hypothetical protein
MMAARKGYQSAARIVRDAGGVLVGRTRLQKVAYLTQLAGFPGEFEFEYRHYGPFSEDLASAMEIASGLGLVQEEERRADWGGRYSIYRTTDRTAECSGDSRSKFISCAAQIGAVELELAATAAFLYVEEGIGRSRAGDPWEATAQLKPEKAGSGRLERAKAAYRKLQALETPSPLPRIM